MANANSKSVDDHVDKLIGEEIMAAYYAGPLTSNPTVQPHEEAAVKSDRETAAILGYNEHDTESFIKNRLMSRRYAAHIRQQEQMKIGESVNVILNSTLKREFDRQRSQAAGHNKVRVYGPNESRDRWLYEKRQNDLMKWNAILTEFKKVRTERKWQSVDLSGIRNAVTRYADHFGFELRKGTGGRPTTAK